MPDAAVLSTPNEKAISKDELVPLTISPECAVQPVELLKHLAGADGNAFARRPVVPPN